MQVRRIQIDPRLAPYIYSIWTFTCETGFLPNDISTHPPDGRPLLLLTVGGSMTSRIDHHTTDHPEGRVMIIGQIDKPAVVSSNGAFINLGVEFRPGAAYRFLGISMKELLNAEYPLN